MPPADEPRASDVSVLVATGDRVFVVDPETGTAEEGDLGDRDPTCLAAGTAGGPVWCGNADGLLRSDDGGRSWRSSGLEGEEVTAVVASPNEVGDGGAVVYVGTEPSAVHRTEDGGETWRRCDGLLDLPSSSTWSFPPRPDTHHVRWIAPHPADPGRLFVAVEAGALITTPDGGGTWRDRVEDGPYDTHELAIHREAPDRLRVAAGDGYYESDDAGAGWRSPEDGLEVGYLRSVAIDPGDPETVVVSAASRAHTAYVAGHADGRIYRRVGDGPWKRVTDGWPDPPATVAPLLRPGNGSGELWAASELGLHRSVDGGASWEIAVELDPVPRTIRGLAVLG